MVQSLYHALVFYKETAGFQFGWALPESGARGFGRNPMWLSTPQPESRTARYVRLATPGRLRPIQRISHNNMQLI